MKQVFEVVMLDQLVDIMDRIAESTGTKFTRDESVGYKSRMREAIARIVSSALDRVTSGYDLGPSPHEILVEEHAKERNTTNALFEDNLRMLIGRMPKTAHVYVENIGKTVNFVIIVSDKPIRGKAKNRILP